MKLIDAFRNRAEAPKNKHLNYYQFYFVRLTELLAVIVVSKIYSAAVISFIFAVSTTVFVIVIIATIFYFGVLNQNLWCLIYRVSQEECAILRESVSYVKLYRYNPKHLYPKLNGYGDNGQRSLKL